MIKSNQVGIVNEIEPEFQNYDEMEYKENVSIDRKSTRLNSSHSQQSRMPSSA